MTDYTLTRGKREVRMKKVPNCKLCRWAEDGGGAGLFARTRTCAAQGAREAAQVYGTRECQALYEEKPKAPGENTSRYPQRPGGGYGAVGSVP